MCRIVMAIVLTLSVTLSASADESQNIQIVRAMATAINDRNLDALNNFVAPDDVVFLMCHGQYCKSISLEFWNGGQS